MTSRIAAIGYRLVLAAMSITAMAVQLVGAHLPLGYSAFGVFTYSTNLSNILISIVFLVTALRLLTDRAAPTLTDTAIRGSTVVYIAFVGLVFNLLLQDTDLSDIIPRASRLPVSVSGQDAPRLGCAFQWFSGAMSHRNAQVVPDGAATAGRSGTGSGDEAGRREHQRGRQYA